MKTLAKSDPSNLVIEVLSETEVKLSHTVQASKNDLRIQIESWTFDFRGVTRSELLQLASRTVKIIKQRDWRVDKYRSNAKIWDNCTFKVRDVIDNLGRRAPVDAVTAAERALDKLSDEQLTALIASRKAKK